MTTYIAWNTNANAPGCLGEVRSNFDSGTFLVRGARKCPVYASDFGWSIKDVQHPGNQCEHVGTIGLTDCNECGMTSNEFAVASRDWLLENDGAIAEDPGYFDFRFFSEEELGLTERDEAAMKLMTKAIERTIPGLHEQENLGDEAIVHVKYFTPDANWAYYATGYDPEERMFFGLVKGEGYPYPGRLRYSNEEGMGRFSMGQLEEMRGLLNLPVERDLHFKPTKLSDVRAEMSWRQ